MQSNGWVQGLAGAIGLLVIKFAAYAWQPQRRLVVGVVAVALGLPLGSLLFHAAAKDQLEATGDYVVRPEHVFATTGPEWIRRDVVAEAFDRGGLGERSLLDGDLVQKVADAFATVPWVREVTEVRKLPGGRIEVDLDYREPVAMVEVTLPDGSGGLVFVDRFGVLLPTEDFRTSDAAAYLRIAPEYVRLPTSTAGSAWGDERIERSAALAGVLKSRRETWSLHRIHLPADPAAPVRLVSRSGGQIVWGALPGVGSGDEPTPDVKLARIAQVTKNKGLSGASEGLVLEVRGK